MASSNNLIKLDGQERRKNIRWHEKLSAEIIFFSDLIINDIPQELSGTIHNLSASGVCFEVPSLDDTWKNTITTPFTKIGVKFTLENQTHYCYALGRAAWVRPQENETGFIIGMEFLDIPSAMQQLITNYVIFQYFEKAKK